MPSNSRSLVVKEGHQPSVRKPECTLPARERLFVPSDKHGISSDSKAERIDIEETKKKKVLTIYYALFCFVCKVVMDSEAVQTAVLHCFCFHVFYFI